MAAVLSKSSPTRMVDIRPTQTTFETSNRYVQSFLAYDLFSAIEVGSVRGVRSVLLSYPDLDLNFHIKDVTPLSLALYKKHFDIFHLFMRHNERARRMDLNMISKDHLGRVEPPLITACRLHFCEGIMTLVDQGADIDCPDGQGHTALRVAALLQMPDLVDYLIAKGASVSRVDRLKCSPLLAALMYRVSSMIIKMLIVHGSALYSHHPSAERCPLFWAAKHGNGEIVKLVLMAGVPMAQIRTVKAALMNSFNVDPMIMELLESETRSPPSLQHLCKSVIRHSVSGLTSGKHFVKSTESLPLPLSLIQFLLLNR
ncbi:ankyrin repeat and SOCS box protein 8-like [Littorina saxatilis]|uniref:SOCS box domain-containing protein n=1 Tax=Littorina saxatilis TaxID=31220 RepID=A0AAN9C2R2_9CAEN